MARLIVWALVALAGVACGIALEGRIDVGTPDARPEACP